MQTCAAVYQAACDKTMGNLDNRLNVELGKKNEIFYTTAKKIVKLVELQSLDLVMVANCRQIRKIYPCEACKFCIHLYKAGESYHFHGNFSSFLT